jgi:hypothetical protein
MTAQTLVLPYRRASPIHIPRRDLVLAASDSLALRVSIVETDDPDALALEMTGGLGGPSLQLIVWRDAPSFRWDYGAPCVPYAVGDALWQGAGVISDAVGSFDITIPAAVFTGWPRRAGFAVVLAWGAQTETLAIGTLHITAMAPTTTTTTEPIATDDLVPITTD